MAIELIFATHNQNKVKEIQSLMPEGIVVKSLDDIGFHEDIKETGSTLSENSLIKAQFIFDTYGKNCFADDSGLEVDVLEGAPGVFSARYAGPQKNDQDNINLLLKNLINKEDRKARFATCISLIIDGEIHQFTGFVEGAIIDDQKGTNGFGYDPIFVPENHSKTFAELNMNEKNQMSHRARAFAKMVAFLRE
ncbi:MAG: non-canonical purine NTP diphosphatase [Bacteroidota bacterium]